MRTSVVVFLAIAATTACSPEAPAAAPVQPAASTTVAEATPAPPVASAAPSASADAEAIRTVAPDQRELSEAGRAMAVEELERATEAARKEANGGPLRVFGVAAGGTLAKLGLENGDRLVSLDDRPLAAESDARGALAAARKAAGMTLKIERKGQPLVLRYSVRAPR